MPSKTLTKPAAKLYGIIVVKNSLFIVALFQTLVLFNRYETNSDNIWIIATIWAGFATIKYFVDLPIWLVLLDGIPFTKAFRIGVELNLDLKGIRYRGWLYNTLLGALFIVSVFGLLILYISNQDTILLFSGISLIAYMILKLLLDKVQDLALLIKLKNIHLDTKSIYKKVFDIKLTNFLQLQLRMMPNILLSILTIGLFEPYLTQKRKCLLIDYVHTLERNRHEKI